MNRLASLLPVAALFVVTGCKPEAEPDGAQPVGAAQAQPVGNALSASVLESAGRYSPDGAAFGGSCTVVYDGDSTDVDGDEIPDNGNSVTATNCLSERGDAVANASYSVDDTLVEAAAAVFPFNFSISGHWDITGTDGETTLSVAADRTITGNSDADSFGGADSASVSADVTAPNAHFSSDESYSWDTEYVHQGPLFGDGLMSLNGEWNVEMEAEQGEDSAAVYANATVATLGTGLQLSTACASHVVGGTMAATYDAGASENDQSASVTATLTVVFSACDVWTTTYTEAVTPGT